MSTVSRVLTRGLVIAALATATAAMVPGGSPAHAAGRANPNTPVGSAARPLGNTNWNFQMTFDTGTFTYLLSPLTKSGTTLTGSVLPPNTSCPGQISGTLVRGTLNMTFTFPNTGCSADQVNLTGKLYIRRGRGRGTFTANFECASTCSWTGTKTG